MVSEIATDNIRFMRDIILIFSILKLRVDKFIWALGEGLRTKVIAMKIDTIVDTIEMATRFEKTLLIT